MIRQATHIRQLWRGIMMHPLQAAWLVSLLFSLALWQMFPRVEHTTQLVAASTDFITGATSMSSAATLSEADAILYKLSFAADEKGEFATANSLMTQITNTRLIGHLLAARYLNPDYGATTAELSQWLARYSDHPEAVKIAHLARTRGLDVAAIDNETPLRGEGYAEHLGRTTMPDGWYRGLALWREHNYSAAQPLFAKVGDDEALSDWQRSAGYYWAYRAAHMQNKTAAAQKNLTAASAYRTTFYGLLAVQQMTATPTLDATAPKVASALRNNPQTIRAALLTQIGRSDDAEDQLRQLYTSLEDRDRPAVVTLAHELNLPNLQVRLAGMPQLSPAEALFASYPAPEFIRTAQKEVSPALMLAIARNESGFRDSATNRSSGALGMMQMLPATAHAIERRVGLSKLELASAGNVNDTVAARLNDPATSVRYGAQYLKILAHEPAIGSNLIRILAGYNAGPGTVAGWQSMARQVDDPLLYVESIPYPETHNYVMQVMAQYWVYQLLIGEKPTTLAAMAHGQWPVL